MPGRVEHEGDAFPAHILKPDVAGILDGLAVVAAHAVAQLGHGFVDFPFHLDGIVGPIRERVHVADLFGDVLGRIFHLGAVFSGHGFEQHLPEIRAEQVDERARPLADGVVDGGESAPLELGEAPRSHAPDFFQRKRMQQGPGVVVGEHQHAAVRLTQIGGQLGVRLGERDADGADEAGLPIHRVLDLIGQAADLQGRELAPMGHIQEKLIHRIAFHVGRERIERGADLLGNGLVFFIMHLHEHDVRADLRGFERAHGGLDAEFARLVAGRGHDATRGTVLFAPPAHDDGDAVQVVRQLLHLGVKAVHVQMQIQPGPRIHMLLPRRNGVVQGDAVDVSV